MVPKPISAIYHDGASVNAPAPFGVGVWGVCCSYVMLKYGMLLGCCDFPRGYAVTAVCLLRQQGGDGMAELDSRYSVGDAELDMQHNKMFVLLARMSDLVEENNLSAKADLHDILNDITNYARLHFEYEESVLLKANYANLAEQKESHHRYNDVVTNFNVSAISNGLDASIVYKFLYKWWIDHIIKEDFMYRNCVMLFNKNRESSRVIGDGGRYLAAPL